jgi:hypothetical protein
MEKRMSIVKLIEVSKSSNVINGAGYTLKEIFVNPEHVVCLREDYHTLQLLQEGRLPDNLDTRQKFTKVQMNRGSTGLDVIVVGCPSVVEEKLNVSRRVLLKG